jgi:hypothetical protein
MSQEREMIEIEDLKSRLSKLNEHIAEMRGYL